MEHILDVESKVFEEIKEHKAAEMRIPKKIAGAEVKKGDTLKLYHPEDETEALRVEITGISKEDAVKEKETFLVVSFALLEWMCRLETELDEMLREEKAWMEGML